MTTPRAVCVVPFCKNSSAKFAGQRYICGPHWRAIPKRLKRRDRAIIRALRKRGEVVGNRSATKRAHRLLWRTWDALEAAAKAAAGGI